MKGAHVCKACGNDTFTEGKLGNSFTSVTSIRKVRGGSPLILTICKRCGEVASMRVWDPEKYQQD